MIPDLHSFKGNSNDLKQALEECFPIGKATSTEVAAFARTYFSLRTSNRLSAVFVNSRNIICHAEARRRDFWELIGLYRSLWIVAFEFDKEIVQLQPPLNRNGMEWTEGVELNLQPATLIKIDATIHSIGL